MGRRTFDFGARHGIRKSDGAALLGGTLRAEPDGSIVAQASLFHLSPAGHRQTRAFNDRSAAGNALSPLHALGLTGYLPTWALPRVIVNNLVALSLKNKKSPIGIRPGLPPPKPSLAGLGRTLSRAPAETTLSPTLERWCFPPPGVTKPHRAQGIQSGMQTRPRTLSADSRRYSGLALKQPFAQSSNSPMPPAPEFRLLSAVFLLCRPEHFQAPAPSLWWEGDRRKSAPPWYRPKGGACGGRLSTVTVFMSWPPEPRSSKSGVGAIWRERIFSAFRGLSSTE